MTSDSQSFWLVVHGPDDEPLGEAVLSCATPQEAAIIAFSTASPYGHDLFSDAGFVGRFEPALSVEDDAWTDCAIGA